MSAKKKFDQRPPWLFGSCLTTTEREVYTALYSHKWMKDGARPSIQRIADMVGVSKSVVKAVIRRLTRLGVLVVEPRVKGNQRLPNAYTFPDPPWSFFTAGQRVADVPEVGRLTTGGGAADNPTPQAAGNPGVGRPAVPEVDRDEVEQEQADISGSAGQAASGGYALRGSQEGPKGWGQARATAGTAGSSTGRGSTAGPPLAPAGSAGSLAGSTGSGSAGPAGPGSGDESPATNKKTTWNCNVSTESKGERYKRPLDDTDTEMWVSLVAVHARDQLHIPAHKREATLTSARYLLDHDKKDHNEVQRVIRRAATDGRYRHVTNLWMVRQNYAEILADIDSGKEPLPKDKRRSRSTSPAFTPDVEKQASAAPVPEFSQLSDLDKPGHYDLEEERRKEREMEADPVYQRIYQQKRAEHPNPVSKSLLKCLARGEWERRQNPDKTPGGTVRVLDF